MEEMISDPEYDRFSSSLREKFPVHYEREARKKFWRRVLWSLVTLGAVGYVAAGIYMKWRID